MKAPDKIYIRPQTNPNMLGGLWSGKPTKEATIPYIRKDALMEWANKELSIRRDSGDADFLPAIVVLDDLIDKINSL